MSLAISTFNQVRNRTINFFMRQSGAELWKAVTSVSRAGQKKGRQRTRQPIRMLQKFYSLGRGSIRLSLPGLNTSIYDNEMKLVEATEESVKADKEGYLTKLKEKSTGLGRKRNKEKMHPLDRGFSGTNVAGQLLGPPPPMGDANFEGFESCCLELKRTVNMTSNFGRKFSMNSLVITGNKAGLIGYAVAKSSTRRPIASVAKALRAASRKLCHVELLENRTIFQDFYAECRNTRIFAQRCPSGFGLVCHPRLAKICEIVGIKDLYAKVEGSTNNYLALTHAFVTGLINQESHQELAERKGLFVVEMSPHQHYLPRIVAAPIYSDIKKEEEISPEERLKLDDFYGEGRYPLKKPPRKPFYVNTPGHLAAQWRKHPFRNHEKAAIRIMADGIVPRWTRENRNNWGKKQHDLMMKGALSLPLGIGLSHVVRDFK